MESDLMQRLISTQTTSDRSVCSLRTPNQFRKTQKVLLAKSAIEIIMHLAFLFFYYADFSIDVYNCYKYKSSSSQLKFGLTLLFVLLPVLLSLVHCLVINHGENKLLNSFFILFKIDFLKE